MKVIFILLPLLVLMGCNTGQKNNSPQINKSKKVDRVLAGNKQVHGENFEDYTEIELVYKHKMNVPKDGFEVRLLDFINSAREGDTAILHLDKTKFNTYSKFILYPFDQQIINAAWILKTHPNIRVIVFSEYPNKGNLKKIVEKKLAKQRAEAIGTKLINLGAGTFQVGPPRTTMIDLRTSKEQRFALFVEAI